MAAKTKGKGSSAQERIAVDLKATCLDEGGMF